MAHEDPVKGAKAALARTEELSTLAKGTRTLRGVGGPPVSTAPGRKVSRTAEQPKGMRSNVALRRKLTGGR